GRDAHPGLALGIRQRPQPALAADLQAGARPSDPGAQAACHPGPCPGADGVACSLDRKSTRLNSSHVKISYAVFCLKKKNQLTRPFIPCLFENGTRNFINVHQHEWKSFTKTVEGREKTNIKKVWHERDVVVVSRRHN